MLRVVLLVTLGLGWVGWVDDYRKVVHRDPEGMPARQKFFWQALIGGVASLYLMFAISAPSSANLWSVMTDWATGGFAVALPARADLIVPFFKTFSYPLGALGFVAVSWCVIVGTSNAVNLTDGLDGLAIMPTVMVAAEPAGPGGPSRPEPEPPVPLPALGQHGSGVYRNGSPLSMCDMHPLALV